MSDFSNLGVCTNLLSNVHHKAIKILRDSGDCCSFHNLWPHILVANERQQKEDSRRLAKVQVKIPNTCVKTPTHIALLFRWNDQKQQTATHQALLLHRPSLHTTLNTPCLEGCNLGNCIHCQRCWDPGLWGFFYLFLSSNRTKIWATRDEFPFIQFFRFCSSCDENKRNKITFNKFQFFLIIFQFVFVARFKIVSLHFYCKWVIYSLRCFCMSMSIFFFSFSFSFFLFKLQL